MMIPQTDNIGELVAYKLPEPDSPLVYMGEQIRYWRKRRGLSQQDLADGCGLVRPSISNLESGNFNTTIETLFKIATVLGVHINQFFEPDKSDDRFTQGYDRGSSDVLMELDHWMREYRDSGGG